VPLSLTERSGISVQTKNTQEKGDNNSPQYKEGEIIEPGERDTHTEKGEQRNTRNKRLHHLMGSSNRCNGKKKKFQSHVPSFPITFDRRRKKR
jgi:hypothetical protein